MFINIPAGSDGCFYKPSIYNQTFVGFYLPGGISWFDTESLGTLDHIQFGYSIPEPGWPVPAAVAGIMIGMKRCRRPGTCRCLHRPCGLH